MSYSKLGINKREQLRKVLDDFSTFSWGPHNGLKNAFEEFGAFIIGGKDALKFYNGPNFSNKYITTQYQKSNSTLQNVEFKTMTVSFTMGVYWFTIEEYRRLLMWLHPYEINTLSFSFAPEWFYTAKLAGISDSTRNILGRDTDGNLRYYTEIKLTFEIQGEGCLHNFDLISIATEGEVEQSLGNPDENGAVIKLQKFNFKNRSSMKVSDLNTPFEFQITLWPKEGMLFPSRVLWPGTSLYNGIEQTSIDEENTYYLGLLVDIPGLKSTHMVFEGLFANLSYNDTSGLAISVTYDSAQGVLLLGSGGDVLISGQTTVFSGKRIIESLKTVSFSLPGILENNLTEEDFKNITFTLYYSNNWTPNLESVLFESRARTNVI